MNGHESFVNRRNHFYLQDFFDTQNSRICASGNPFADKALCGLMASFIVKPLLFEEMSPVRPVTCSVNGKYNESPLSNHVVLIFQHMHGCIPEYDILY